MLIIDVFQSLFIMIVDEIIVCGIISIGEIIDYMLGVNILMGEGYCDLVVFCGVCLIVDFYIDGNCDDVQYFCLLYNVEQVEILCGFNVLLFGCGGIGGILNCVFKKV